VYPLHALMPIDPEPITVAVFKDPAVVVVVVRGKISAADYADAAEKLWSHPEYAPDFPMLIDISQMEPQFSPRELLEMIRFTRANPQSLRGRGALITRTPIQTALALIYNTKLADRVGGGVFSTWDAACDHLGVDLGLIAHLQP